MDNGHPALSGGGIECDGPNRALFPQPPNDPFTQNFVPEEKLEPIDLPEAKLVKTPPPQLSRKDWNAPLPSGGEVYFSFQLVAT